MTATLVQKMISGEVELLVGLTIDPEFAPVVVFGVGGIFVEIWKDVAMAVLPFDRVEAPRMIERIKVGKMLDGSRGRVRADRERFADLPVRFGDFAVLNGDLVSEVDINPLIVTRMEPASEGGIDAQVCAVDGLIMLRAPG